MTPETFVGRSKGITFVVITLNQELSSLPVPKKESFPIPLRYIVVIRRTRTTLNVLQESRIDDYWNIDAHRKLSEPGTGFTKFTLLNEKLPQGRKDSQNFKQPPDLIICGLKMGSSMSKAAQKKEKREWAIEKPKLDWAIEKLRGIPFMDPDVKEF